jgi:hypothetical protein
MTSSFSAGSRSTAAANTFPTPASSAAGTVPAIVEDVDGDMMMEEGSEAGSLKRRRTSSSPYDRASQTMAPALRHRGIPDGISPQIPTEQELLSQPDVSPYYLVCENGLSSPHLFCFFIASPPPLGVVSGGVAEPQGIKVNALQPGNLLTLISQTTSSLCTTSLV